MIQATSLIACLLTLQAGAKTQDKPYIGPTPHPEVQKLLDDGQKEGLSWEQKTLIFERARLVAKEKKDYCGEARSLYNLAKVSDNVGDFPKAQERYLAGLDFARRVSDRLYEAKTLNNIGVIYSKLGQPDKELEFYSLALPIQREVNDRRGEATTLNNIGLVYSDLDQPDKALEFYKLAIPIHREVKNRRGEAETLNNIGVIYSKLGQPDKAIEFCKLALPIQREVNDRRGEATTLDNIGIVYSDLGQPDKALEFYNLALSIQREVKNRRSEANMLSNIGSVYSVLGQPNKALEFYNLALPIQREVKNRRGEAETLNRIGVIYSELGQPDQALDFYNLALPIRQEEKDPSGEAETLNNIGVIYSDLGQPDKALEFYNLALLIQREVKNQRGEATTLHNMGGVYTDLGQPDKALEFSNLALSIRREVRDRRGEAITLSNIGGIYTDLGQPYKALEIYNLALPIRREVRDRRGEAITLSNIGSVYSDLGQPDKALEFYSLALPIQREVKNRRSEANMLSNIGSVYSVLGQPNKALEFYNLALPIQREIKNRSGEATTLDNVATVCRKMNNVALAVVYAKQSVSLTQQLRDSTRALDKKLQDSFTNSVEARYRDLSDMLIEQGRIVEAQQVLALLKDRELLNFLNQRSTSTEGVSLTPIEAKWQAEYEKLVSNLASVAAEKKKLEDIRFSLRTDTENKRLAEIEPELERANKAFQAFLASLQEEFKKFDVNRERLDDLSSSQALGRTLKKLPDYAAVYTLVTEDHVRTLLAVPNARIVSQAPVKVPYKDLSAKILKFRSQVQNPALDPRELGAELYDLLIRPLEPSLKASGTKQIVWSLDSVLRYVPIWALYDRESKQYLVEKYPSSIFTPRTVDRLAEPGKAPSTASAFGVTESATLKTLSGSISFAALSGTRAELETLRTVFGAKPKLDAEFTEQSFKEGFGSDVVHVATHFRLVPGNEFDSVLLMGKNTGLSLSRFKDLPADCLSNVDLLVLSACDTGVGTPNADGSEFEGLALLAQQKGAGAVMASLWPVNDDATSKLMGDFYTFRKTHPEWTKVEALREAQLRMIRGENKLGENWSPPRGPNTPETNAPKWPKTEPAYKHPYFWAPFVITGNVK
jgi:CHAT domain-containing protein/Tfp pilus assembly protein PilF